MYSGSVAVGQRFEAAVSSAVRMRSIFCAKKDPMSLASLFYHYSLGRSGQLPD